VGSWKLANSVYVFSKVHVSTDKVDSYIAILFKFSVTLFFPTSVAFGIRAMAPVELERPAGLAP